MATKKKRKHLPEISCVYKVLNLKTREFYIGSTKNLYLRWLHHKAKSTWKQAPKKKLYQNMMEYGIENFICEPLKEYPEEKLLDREAYWINKLKPSLNSNAVYADPEKYRLAKNRLTKEWKLKNADYNRELNRNWAQRNPDKIREYRHRQYLKRKAGKKNG